MPSPWTEVDDTSRFYFTGLGILMKGITFTPDEASLLRYLCKHAEKSDEDYLGAIRVVRADRAASRLLDQLIRTLKAHGKGPELKAYYDRAA